MSSNFNTNKEVKTRLKKNKKDGNDKLFGILSKTFIDKERHFGKNLSNTRYNQAHKNYLNKQGAFFKTSNADSKLANSTLSSFIANINYNKKQIPSDIPLSECDAKVKGNPQYVTEYINEIVECFRENEVKIFINIVKEFP